MSEAFQFGPIRYEQVVPLDADAHNNKYIDVSGLSGLIRNAQHVPIAMSEFLQAAAHFPIVFTPSELPLPVAVMSLNAGKNPFLDATEGWDQAVYLPAALRRWPFLLATITNSDNFAVALDATLVRDAAEGNRPLVIDGEQSDYLKAKIELSRQLAIALDETRVVCEQLRDAGLFKQQNIEVTISDGTRRKIGEHFVVDVDKVNSLPEDHVVDYHRRGIFTMINAHQTSMNQLRKLASMT